jgi:hypothetical protein
MKNYYYGLLNTIVLFIFALCFSTSSYGQFTYGNIVVLQAGDGTIPLANTGNAIVLREFSPNGTPGFTVAASPSGTNALIISGSATSEGGLSLSPDLKLLVFGGYATNLPYSASLPGTTSTAVNRGVGAVDAAGNFTRVATSTSFFSGNNIRSVVSDGQSNYWASGGNNGTNYFGTASAPVQGIQTTITNKRNMRIFNNELYFSTGSGTIGIYKVNSGLPVTSGNTASIVINTAGPSTVSASPYEFYFNPAMTVCYVADDRTFANGGHIMKFVNTGSAWTYTYSLSTGTTSARGVIADFSGANPIVYATTSETSNNRLVAIEDIGAGSSFTLLATSGNTNTAFRGLSFAPCASPQIVSAVSGGSVCSNSQLSLSVTVSGSAPSYTWTGAGTFNNANIANPLVSNPQTGNYTITASNACGTASNVVSVTVEAAPVLTVSASQNTLCAGEQLTLTASGANTYTWSNSVTNGLGFAASTSTTYTVSGSAANGCVSTETVNIIVNSLPVITANSLSVCPGDQGTLTATGANTYSWSTGDNTASTVVAPTIATSYTVTGTSVEGCESETVITVAMINTPFLTVNSPTICAGTTVTLSASGADTYTWSTGSVGSTVVVTPTVTETYTVTGSVNGCSIVDLQTTNVYVNQLPVLTVNSTSTLLCSGTSATLTAGGATSYTWSEGAATSATIVVTPTISTTYTLQGEDNNNCYNEFLFTQNVSPCAGLSEASFANEWILFPNPATELFYIKSEKVLSRVELYNINGKLIKCFDLNTSEYTVKDLASGIYMLVLTDISGIRSVKKFVKE